MAEEPRYPKRKKTVSFTLQPYICDYDSDDDIDNDIDVDEHIDIDNINSDCDEESDDQSTPDSSFPSLMDHSEFEFDKYVARDGTIWSEDSQSTNFHFPEEHVPSLTDVSQAATTMLGNFFDFLCAYMYLVIWLQQTRITILNAQTVNQI